MGLVPARRPGWSLEPRRKSGPRGMAAHPPSGGGQNPAYRPSGNFSFGAANAPETDRFVAALLAMVLGANGEAETIERLGISALAGL